MITQRLLLSLQENIYAAKTHNIIQLNDIKTQASNIYGVEIPLNCKKTENEVNRDRRDAFHGCMQQVCSNQLMDETICRG